jgi:hypothetical protein
VFVFSHDPLDITSPSFPEYPINPYSSHAYLSVLAYIVHKPYMIDPPLNDDTTFIVKECTPVFGMGCNPTTLAKLPSELFFTNPSTISNYELLTSVSASSNKN